jgi:hypothetical protein
MILFVQQKVEILSRKKYLLIQRMIKLEDVAERVKERAEVKLKMRASSMPPEIKFEINLKGGDELIDAVKAQVSERGVTKVATSIEGNFS